MEGWIKINRSMLKWGWYSDANTMRVFFDILLHANYERGEYRGIVVEAGECVIGLNAISKRLKISMQSTRTALKHLRETGEISTSKSTNRFTVVKVENWGKYQDCAIEINNQANNQLTSNQQATNKQLTTSKKLRNKEVKKERNKSTVLSPESIADMTDWKKLNMLCPKCKKYIFEKMCENENGKYTIYGHPDFKTGKCDYITTRYEHLIEPITYQSKIDAAERAKEYTTEEKQANKIKLQRVLGGMFR